MRAVGAGFYYSDQVIPVFDESGIRYHPRPPDKRLVSLADTSWLRDFFYDVIAIGGNSSSLSDAELALLGAFPKLIDLDVRSTNVTHRGLAHVQQCKRLYQLQASNILIDRSGMPYIHRLNQLRVLDLGYTDVEDDDVMALAEMPNLKRVGLSHSLVGEDTIARLRKARPDMYVSYTPRPEIRAPHIKLNNLGMYFYSGSTPEIERRPLTLDDARFLHERSRIVIEKFTYGVLRQSDDREAWNDKRCVAIAQLAEKLPDEAIIPLLASILRDRSDDPTVRAAAAFALGAISSPLAVELLIDALPEGDDIGRTAECALGALTNAKVVHTDPNYAGELPPELRLKRQGQWRAWWQANKKKMRFQSHPAGRPETVLAPENAVSKDENP